MKKALFVLAIALCTGSLPAGAWGTTGHRVVAEIAQRHLNKKAKQRFMELTNGYDLSYWANWSDFIKSDTTGKWRQNGPWHYVNIPGNLPPDSALIIIKQQAGPSLYTQIPAMMAILNNNTATLPEKQEALWWLIHLVGDLHQPMHIGRAEDQGGNRINVMWFNEATNLHAVWDEFIVDHQQYSYTEFACQIDRASAEQIKIWQNIPGDEWYLETYALANNVYNATPAGAKLSYRYNFLFKNVLETQLLKGGVRLAKILNDILG